jgi:hypothetical protein
MRNPKRDHGSVTTKETEGPRPMSQHTIAENLATISVEVGETFPRVVNTRRTHQQPQAKPTSPTLMTQRPAASAERRVNIEKRELSP